MKRLFNLAACLIFSVNTFATVQYTYVNENVIQGSLRSYDLDLDGDDDFSFEEDTYYGEINCSKETSEYAGETSSPYWPKAYSQGSGLGTFSWINDSGARIAGSYANFNYATKYIMVRFRNANNQLFYGWILVEGSAGTREWDIRIVSYAYNDVLGQSLAPGQTTAPTGIESFDASALSTTFTDGSVSFDGLDKVDEIRIHSVDGRHAATINKPISNQAYGIRSIGNVLVVSFFRKEELLTSIKYFVH